LNPRKTLEVFLSIGRILDLTNNASERDPRKMLVGWKGMGAPDKYGEYVDFQEVALNLVTDALLHPHPCPLMEVVTRGKSSLFY